jgi:hypothetical protein
MERNSFNGYLTHKDGVGKHIVPNGFKVSAGHTVLENGGNT